ncbi:MAG TPA: alkaline phosphatase family protein [Thermoanaerobaculia bacterium]|nr:alkaline phosphatase family protein [Thermoanaerobaculia bacterium]
MNSPYGRRRSADSAALTAAAITLPLALLALLVGCRAAEKEPTPPPSAPIPEGAPRLVLFLVVDQVRADYLTRFRPLFEHGLARLLEESAVFTDNHQAHARTETAAGHATLATGTFPSSHGVVGNYWFDRASGEEVYSAVDPEVGRSARNLKRPTLGDLFKRSWPESKVFALGGKDRSAILTAGAEADAAYWYSSRTGTFTTTAAYRAEGEAEPEWLAAFHQRKLLDRLFGETWSPLLPAGEAAKYGVEPLDRGDFSRGFPYSIGSFSVVPDAAFYGAIYSTPFVDGYVVDLAKALIDGEGLGQDATPDFLGVTLSSLDSIGHTYGPDAPETLDTLMRIDRRLGDLLDFVDERVGRDQVIVTLSSDHGVGRVPEVARVGGEDAGRFGTEQVVCVQQLGARITREMALEGIDWMPEMGYLDRATLASRQVDAERVLDALAAGLPACPRIDRVLRPRDLALDSDDQMVRLFARSYDPERSGDFFVVLAPDTLATTTTASHGTPYRYDTWVPWLLRLPGVAPVVIGRATATVDVVPTLAAIYGLQGVSFDGLDRGPWLLGGATTTPSP